MPWLKGLVVTLYGWYRKTTEPLEGSLFQLFEADATGDNVSLQLPNTGFEWNGKSADFARNFVEVSKD